MTIPTFVDFESVSRADLRRVGGRQYWAHPSTRVLCAVLHFPEHGRVWWTPADGPLFGPGDSVGWVAAHNWSGFDRFAWGRLGWPKPTREIDTSVLARRGGLPGSLEALAGVLGHDVKDKEGSRLTVGFSTCRRPTKKTAHLGPTREEIPAAVWAALSPSEKREVGVQKEPTPEEMARVLEYCDRDVGPLVEAWPMLEPFLDAEPEVEEADRICNDRGICFDLDLARALLEIDARLSREACASVGLSAQALNSNVQFPALVRAAGAPCPDATFATVEPLTEHPDPRVRALAEARLSLASIARGKLEAGLARTSADGRIRDSHRYIGAHTWRWAGVGLQVQNLPWINKRDQ